MTNENRTPICLFVQIAEWIRRDAACREELASLSRLDLARMAQELDVDEADLRPLLPAVADSAKRVDQALTVRGIDAEALRRTDPAGMHALARTCARCRFTARCRIALAAGDLSDVAEYCDNFEAFAALIRH